jgi:hypothetical protein
MDYTTLERVKAALGATETTDDTLLEGLVTAASREFDRRCTGVNRMDAVDYFELEDVADEMLRGFVDKEGRIVCYPRKGQVNSVSSLAYRTSPLEGWVEVDSEAVSIEGATVISWVSASGLRGKPLQILVSYNGGMAADVDELPADLIEAVTVLTARFYREARTGLTDSVGVAEVGVLVYTKAIPVRVLDTLRRYERVVPW